jgi:hypothetical protein
VHLWGEAAHDVGGPSSSLPESVPVSSSGAPLVSVSPEPLPSVPLLLVDPGSGSVSPEPVSAGVPVDPRPGPGRLGGVLGHPGRQATSARTER